MKQESVEYALIAKFLSGESSNEETEKIKKWLNESDDNTLILKQVINIWNNSGNSPECDKINTREALSRLMSKINRTSVRVRFADHWKKVAAVLIISLLAGNLLINYYKAGAKQYSGPVYNELYAAFGTRSALKLSDGTFVWLNSGSSIKYPDRFIGNERTVFLSGEAYFEVKSDPKHPFTVKSKLLETKVTGTKFNISDYPASDFSEVTLVEGKLDVILPFSDGRSEIAKTIAPNQHFTYNKKTGNSYVTETDPYKFYSWKDGKIIFRDEPLSHVIEKIGNIFNVDIIIKGKNINDYRYRATFEDESLEDILKLLKISSPIDYIESKRVPLPDGTFSKKKITIIPAIHK